VASKLLVKLISARIKWLLKATEKYPEKTTERPKISPPVIEWPFEEGTS
jgi:hypothetical protein